MNTKLCKKCNVLKSVTDFWVDKKSKDKLTYSCKSCLKEKTIKYYHDNLEKGRASRRETRRREYRKDRNKVLSLNKKYSNSEKGKVTRSQYNLANKEKRNEKRRQKMKEDINFRLSNRLRSRLYLALKNNQKNGSAVKDLGCTIPELKIYIESKFTPGMSWDNWSLKGWHIDHITPLASFVLNDREQFLKAVHYTNLQPLWADENLLKADKYA